MKASLTPRRRTLILAGLLAVSTSASAAPVPAPVVAIPVNGAGGVPTNPLILVTANAGGDLELVDDGAAIVDVDVARQDLRVGFAERLEVSDALRPATRYTVREVRDGEVLVEHTSFTTGDAADDAAPADPVVEVDSVETVQKTSGRFQRASLSVDADDDVAIVSVVDGSSSYFDILGGEFAGGIVIDGSGARSLAVTAIDHAGNASDPVDVELDLGDPPFFGCSTTSTSGVLWAAPLLLLLGRRRRVGRAGQLALALPVALAATTASAVPSKFTSPPAPESGAAGVPTNPLVLAVLDHPSGSLQLVDDGAAIVDATVTTQAGSVGDFQRLVVPGGLRPTTRYTLLEMSGDELVVAHTSFTTGDGPDDAAPAPPVVTVDEDATWQRPRQDLQQATLLIAADADVDVVHVVDRDRDWFAILGSEAPGGVVVFATGGGVQTLSIAAVDRAGNASEPVDVNVDFGPPTSAGEGCASSPSSSSSSLATFAVVGAVLANVRRRRV